MWPGVSVNTVGKKCSEVPETLIRWNQMYVYINKKTRRCWCAVNHTASLHWWRRGGRAASLQGLCLKEKSTQKWEFSLYLLAAMLKKFPQEHSWSSATKQPLQRLLKNRSRWKLELKTSLEALRSQIDFKWCCSHPRCALSLVLTVLALQLRWKSLLKATTGGFDIRLILETKVVVFSTVKTKN